VSDSAIVLPYATEDLGRKNPFSEDMEFAAIMCIAEAKRKKQGLLGATAEKLASISKLHYPLWAIPWSDNCLLLEGMGTISSNVLRLKPPDVENFIENLRKARTSKEPYLNTLRSHLETFSAFASQTELPVKGLVKNKELLHDILNYLKDSQTKTDSSVFQTSLIQPTINKGDAVEIVDEILGRYNELQSEIKGLQFATRKINDESNWHVNKLKQELQEIQEDFEERISNTKSEVNERRKELETERNEKIERITAAKDQEISAKTSEKKILENELTRLEQDKSEYKTRKDLRKSKRDKVGQARWDARLRNVQRRISVLKRKISTLSDTVARAEEKAEKAKRKVCSAYEKLIEEEEQKILVLETSRDAKVEKQNEEIQALNQTTLAITDKIERLISQMKACSLALAEATIPWKIEIPTLISVPFYAIQYKVGSETRRVFRSPVIVQDFQGLLMKIRRTLRTYSLEARLGSLLRPRSKGLETIFDSYERKMNYDKEARIMLDQLCISRNLLASTDFKEKIRSGLEGLEFEGWIKADEKKTISQTYVTK
jgi:predicted  nucleic acid-binding Zn-ribbon protein